MNQLSNINLPYQLSFPKLILGSVVLLFVAAVITLSNLGGEFIPALEEGDFAVDTKSTYR